MFSQTINNWFSKVKQTLFKYKDGFYELPILSNSPESTIASIRKMPFVKFSKKNETFSSNNPFIKAHVYYHEIEKGLWYMHADALYKENVSYKRINEKKLSSEYYLLFLEIARTEMQDKEGLIDGMSYSNSSWVLFKPKAGITNCRFKGNKTTALTLYFDQEWLNHKLNKFKKFDTSILKSFFDSKSKLIIGHEEIKTAKTISKISKKLFQKKTDNSTTEKEWQNFAFDFIGFFIDKYEKDHTSNHLIEIAHLDRKKMIHAEKILLDGLYGNFEGIEKVAAEVGLSPTKLKSNFKLAFGATVFQYFRQKQMEAAKIIILKKELPIKEVALLFGYKNPSRFTDAYKECIGILPSETV